MNSDPERISELLDEGISSLNEAINLINKLGIDSKTDAVATLASAIGNILYSRTFLPVNPDDPHDELPEPDLDLTEEQQKKVDLLTHEQLENIDRRIIASSSTQWRKVARIVGATMQEDKIGGIPDIFYSQRVRKLVEDGRLESEGNLDYMGRSEVRLPDTLKS
ncbi:MAG TPA: DUF3658 domain-containing protein [Pyrinomonadaceae bacterium]|nr:DUF3658 domain-containing protein [Pyrinomonadaceae bacterium]